MILGLGNDIVDIPRIERTYWRDMGVVNLASGRPTLRLTGGAAEQLKRITPLGFEARIDLTLSDDYPLAQAIVIISSIPLKDDIR
jgi:holo-[acyl-carrier protein] synthase